MIVLFVIIKIINATLQITLLFLYYDVMMIEINIKSNIAKKFKIMLYNSKNLFIVL